MFQFGNATLHFAFYGFFNKSFFRVQNYIFQKEKWYLKKIFFHLKSKIQNLPLINHRSTSTGFYAQGVKAILCNWNSWTFNSLCNMNLNILALLSISNHPLSSLQKNIYGELLSKLYISMEQKFLLVLIWLHSNYIDALPIILIYNIFSMNYLKLDHVFITFNSVKYFTPRLWIKILLWTKRNYLEPALLLTKDFLTMYLNNNDLRYFDFKLSLRLWLLPCFRFIKGDEFP